MSINNITLSTDRHCTGCGACSAICPTHAIRIIENENGFLSPILDSSKCVDCGVCQRVCYKYLTPSDLPSIKDGECIAMCSRDKDTLQTTSSGGFAYELSKWGLTQGYHIVGVAYDYKTDRARTIIVDNIDDLELLKGSKYLQSHTEQAFHSLLKNAKENPEQGFICFGTPCQIFGLRRAIELKHLSNDFIFVDLFCHGVPSLLVWDPYIKKHRQRLGDISAINFRYKGNGWHQYTIRISGCNGTYTQYAYKDTFYRYFFDNVALNESCFSCSLRKDNVASDIRIGDFHGSTYEHREDGVSAIITNSDKGRRVLDNLQQIDSICFIAKHNTADCINSQNPHDYRGVDLRNSVITRLKQNDITETQHWYERQFTFKKQVYLRFKRIAALLPSEVIIKLRRFIKRLS